MVVLVTGATGGLGRAVVARLLAEGRTVRILTRRPFLAAGLFARSVALHEWHPGSEPVPAEALDGVTGVVHLMGAPHAGGPARDRSALAVSSRVEATRRLVESLENHPVRLVVASVAMPPPAVKPARSSVPAKELAAVEMLDDSLEDVAGEDIAEMDAAGQSRASPASRTSGSDGLAGPLTWEAEALIAEASGSQVVIVRLGLLATPGAAVDALVGLARRGLSVAAPTTRIAVIDPEDAAAMLSGLLALPGLGGRVLGVAPQPVYGSALAEALARALALPKAGSMPRLPAPRWLMARQLGLLAPMLQTTVQLVPQRLLAAGAGFMTPDPTALLQAAIARTIAARQERVPSLWLGAVRAGASRLGGWRMATTPATPPATSATPTATASTAPATATRQADAAD